MQSILIISTPLGPLHLVLMFLSYMLQLFSLKASDLVKSNGLNFLLIPNWPLGDLWYSLLPFRNVCLASLFLRVRHWALQCLESFAWPSLIAQRAPLLWPHPLTRAWLHIPLFSHISSCLLVTTIWMPHFQMSKPSPRLPFYSPTQWLKDWRIYICFLSSRFPHNCSM